MKLTLITSTYRAARWLPLYRRHVADVCAQLTAEGIETQLVLIANDARADEVAQFDQLAAALGESLCLRHTPRETIYASWNRALELAQGEAIGFWNVDDEHYVSGYREAAARLREGYTLVDLSYTVMQEYRRWGLWPAQTSYYRPARYTQDKHGRKHGYGPFALIARALFDQVGRFDERFRIAGDLDWSVRSVPYARGLRSAHNGGIFRLHGRNLSDSGNPLQIVENNVIFLRQRQWEELQPADPDLMRGAYERWRADIGDLPALICEWLWGPPARARARQYQRLGRWPWWRRARAALLYRGWLKTDSLAAPRLEETP